MVIEIEVLQRVISNLEEGFSRPRHKIDDGCVVNEARIHAAVVSEVVASFAHKEYNMEVVLNSSIKLRQEHLVFDLLVFAFLARLLHHSANNLFHFLFDSGHVFFTEKVRNLTDSEYSVDILYKRFLCDLIVGEHEDG